MGEEEEWGEGGRRVGSWMEGWGEGGRRVRRGKGKVGGEGENLVLLRKWVGMGKRKAGTGGGNGVIRENREVERMK